MSNTLTIISNGRTIFDGPVLSGSWEYDVNGRITLEAETTPVEQCFLSGTSL